MRRSICLLGLLALTACNSSNSATTPAGNTTPSSNDGAGGDPGASGTNSSDAGAPAGGGSPGKGSTVCLAAPNCPNVRACVKAHCAAEAQPCFGDGFPDVGTASGDCAAMTTCQQGCPCDDGFMSCAAS